VRDYACYLARTLGLMSVCLQAATGEDLTQVAAVFLSARKMFLPYAPLAHSAEAVHQCPIRTQDALCPRGLTFHQADVRPHEDQTLMGLCLRLKAFVGTATSSPVSAPGLPFPVVCLANASSFRHGLEWLNDDQTPIEFAVRERQASAEPPEGRRMPHPSSVGQRKRSPKHAQGFEAGHVAGTAVRP
jgi:hypothetical protein